MMTSGVPLIPLPRRNIRIPLESPISSWLNYLCSCTEDGTSRAAPSLPSWWPFTQGWQFWRIVKWPVFQTCKLCCAPSDGQVQTSCLGSECGSQVSEWSSDWVYPLRFLLKSLGSICRGKGYMLQTLALNGHMVPFIAWMLWWLSGLFNKGFLNITSDVMPFSISLWQRCIKE